MSEELIGTRPIPAELLKEAARLEVSKYDWPNCVPTYALYRTADGRSVLCHWKDMTVANCEQATEFYVREVRTKILRYLKKPTKRMATIIADLMIRARCYRCRYIDLIGKADSTEDDMPFAHNRY